MAATFTGASWVTSVGGVALDVTGMAPGNRVVRQRLNGAIVQVTVNDLSADPQSVYDFSPALGEVNDYYILPTANAAPADALDHITLAVPGARAYLRRLNNPLIFSPVRVLSTGTEGEAVRAMIFDISGRRAPLVVFNSREARRGTITLLTNSRDERNVIEYIVSDGSPLLFNMCASQSFRFLQAAVGDVRWTREGLKAHQFRCELDYVEIEDGEWIGADADYVPPATRAMIYDDIDTLTYQQVYDTYIRYYNLASGTPA